jgi:hypothetical protein
MNCLRFHLSCVRSAAASAEKRIGKKEKASGCCARWRAGSRLLVKDHTLRTRRAKTMPARCCGLLMLVLSQALAWSPAAASRPSLATAVRHSDSMRRCSAPKAYSEDKIDVLVRRGDAGVLIGYGTVQALVDFVLSPLAKSSPDMFTQDLPVLAAPLQGILLAGLWVGITSALNGYRAGATRTLPSKEALIPLVAAWIGSSITMIAAFAAVGLPLDAEVEFVFGSATVVGGWRLLYSNSLPLL